MVSAEINGDKATLRSYPWPAVPGPGGVGGPRAMRMHILSTPPCQ